MSTCIHSHIGIFINIIKQTNLLEIIYKMTMFLRPIIYIGLRPHHVTIKIRCSISSNKCVIYCHHLREGILMSTWLRSNIVISMNIFKQTNLLEIIYQMTMFLWPIILYWPASTSRVHKKIGLTFLAINVYFIVIIFVRSFYSMLS